MRFLPDALLRRCNHFPWWSRGRISVWGWKLRAPTFDRWLALRLHRAGLMGVEDRRFLENHLQPGMTVVDIGANQGLYTLLFASLVGCGGKVFAFEPDDMLYTALAENVRFNGADHVRTRHAALGSKAGAMMLHRSLLNSGDNRLATDMGNSGPREAVQIHVERLDQALTGERVHFIKLDVQGWEMEVFHGMQGLLDQPQNDEMAIYFEFWPQGIRDAGSDPVELLIFLSTNGFAIHQPQSGQPGVLTRDFAALTHGLKGHSYTNLYAVRR